MRILALGNKFISEALVAELKTKGYKDKGNGPWSTHRGVYINTEEGYADITTYVPAKSESYQYTVYGLPEFYNSVVALAEKEINKPKFNIGDYAHLETGPTTCRIVKEYDSETFSGGGILVGNANTFPANLRKATKEEIEEFLKKEAALRGFREGEEVQFEFIISKQKWAAKVNLEYDEYEDKLRLKHKLGDLSLSINEGVSNSDYSGQSDGYVCDLYEKGMWRVSRAQPYKKAPTLTFGGRKVGIGKFTREGKIDVAIDLFVKGSNTRVEARDWYSNVKRIREILKEWKTLSFGGHPIKLQPEEKFKEKTLTFGCTSGTFGEAWAILDECEKLLK